MTADELKSMKKGSFIVMKTGEHPFISKLKLFTKWGIAFDQGVFSVPDHASRTVEHASRESILAAIDRAYPETRPQISSAKAQEQTQRKNTTLKTSM